MREVASAALVDPENFNLIEVTIRQATRSEYRVVSRMLQLYFYDLSELNNEDFDASGRFRCAWLPDFWRKPDHAAFVFLVAGEYAGFALVDNDVVVPGCERSIKDFFVLKKYRRQGVGRQAASALFRAMPGKWEVGQGIPNEPARNFWHDVIGFFNSGDYSEFLLCSGDGATLQIFDNGV